jgi:hypothetical protein
VPAPWSVDQRQQLLALTGSCDVNGQHTWMHHHHQHFPSMPLIREGSKPLARSEHALGNLSPYNTAAALMLTVSAGAAWLAALDTPADQQ